MKNKLLKIICIALTAVVFTGCGKNTADDSVAVRTVESPESIEDAVDTENSLLPEVTDENDISLQDEEPEIEAEETDEEQSDEAEEAEETVEEEEQQPTEAAEEQKDDSLAENSAAAEIIPVADVEQAEQPAEVLPVQETVPAPEPVVVASEIQQYYSRSVFVGDSIMVGYSYYSLAHADACAYYSKFLCCTSFSLRHALNPVTSDSLQPTYMGQKMNVWTAIAQMDVDRVFLMFGTNDLVCYNYETIMEYYISLIANIRAVRPDIEINIISMTPIVYGAPAKGMLTIDGINALNVTLIQNMDTVGYKYVDLFHCIVDETGYLPGSLSSDGYCHMTTAAYQGYWEVCFANYANAQMGY